MAWWHRHEPAAHKGAVAPNLDFLEDPMSNLTLATTAPQIGDRITFILANGERAKAEREVVDTHIDEHSAFAVLDDDSHLVLSDGTGELRVCHVETPWGQIYLELESCVVKRSRSPEAQARIIAASERVIDRALTAGRKMSDRLRPETHLLAANCVRQHALADVASQLSCESELKYSPDLCAIYARAAEQIAGMSPAELVYQR